MRAREGYQANFAAASMGSPADTTAKGYWPSAAPLLPLIVNEKDDEQHCDGNGDIDANCYYLTIDYDISYPLSRTYRT